MTLIERLEAATEGSRELDARIAHHLGWRHSGFRETGEIKEREFKEVADIAGHWHKPGDKFADILNKAEYRAGFAIGRWPDNPPQFSTSLDAALPGENITEFIKVGDCFWAYNLSEDGRLTRGVGKTEPLARRIACLKAREEMK